MDQQTLWQYDLNEELDKVQSGKANQLEVWASTYPLCGLSTNKKEFIIIRTHASLEENGEITTLGLPPWNTVFPENISRPGLTFVDVDSISGKSKRNLTYHLPKGFDYKSLSVEEKMLKIELDNATITCALFQLIMGHAEKTEAYLTEAFQKLLQPTAPEPEVQKSSLNALTTTLFGTLHYVKQDDSFEGTYQLGEQEIAISLVNWEETALKKSVANLEKLLETGLYDRLIAAISQEMIPLYNETWTENGEHIDTTILLEKIAFDAITIYEDGSFVCYFEDGNLFGGHSIQVNVSFDGELDEPFLAG